MTRLTPPTADSHPHGARPALAATRRPKAPPRRDTSPRLRGPVMAVLLALAPLGLAGLTALTSQPAAACAFHQYTPNPTLVDVLLATEQAVLARLDPSDARRLVMDEALLGPDLDGLPLTPTIEARARLSADRSARLLLVRDGAYGPWMELAVLDQSYTAVVRHVLANQSTWAMGGEARRLAYFAPHINAQNPQIRRLALQELDRAPYTALRDLRLAPPRNLAEDLKTGAPDLLPIRVLLAGLSGDQSLAPYLWGELDRAVATELPYLGAYATALIELQGPKAVHGIITRYLKDQDKPPSQPVRTKLLEALAIQYMAAPIATRRVIAKETAALLNGARNADGASGAQGASGAKGQQPRPGTGQSSFARQNRWSPKTGNPADSR